jgi:hypothetical protein
MHLSLSRQVSRLPKRFPVGTTYVVEGRGGEDGNLRVFSRYVVLPNGQRINLGVDVSKTKPALARRPRTRSAAAAQTDGKSRPARSKKISSNGGTPRRHAR